MKIVNTLQTKLLEEDLIQIEIQNLIRNIKMFIIDTHCYKNYV